MIGFISGKLEDIYGNTLLINSQGVGFEVLASQNTITKLGNIGEEVRVYTYLNVREDEMSLFGFATTEEKAMFLKLTTVSGVGPKTAIGILSEISIYDLATAILSGDATSISKIKGIGKKTAERIILELKEKIDNLPLLDKSAPVGEIANSQEFEYAINVLVSLGLTKYDATKRIRELAQPNDKAEDIIQKVLRSL